MGIRSVTTNRTVRPAGAPAPTAAQPTQAPAATAAFEPSRPARGKRVERNPPAANAAQAATECTVAPRLAYPRPQVVRGDGWLNLNGPAWKMGFDKSAVDTPIHVPLPYQAEGSGVADKGIHEQVFYRRTVDVPAAWLQAGRSALLHFGACDFATTVKVNGVVVGTNTGGHVPFSFDVARHLRPGANTIEVDVVDTQDPAQMRGKQSMTGDDVGIDYKCTTGMWQSVWLESAPATRVEKPTITALREDAFVIDAPIAQPRPGLRLVVEARDGARVVSRVEVDASGATAQVKLPIPDAKRWRPDAPHLYDLVLKLVDAGGQAVDEVATYGGLRTIRAQGGKLYVDDVEVYLKGVLHQGYFPGTLMTPKTDGAFSDDVKLMKKMGFNTARIHETVADPQWLYECDRQGLLVWGEKPSARKWDPARVDEWKAEWRRIVDHYKSSPSVMAFVTVNETWGLDALQRSPEQQRFLDDVVRETKAQAPGHLVSGNDGWEQPDGSTIVGVHDYAPDAAALLGRWTPGAGPPTNVWAGLPTFLPGAKYDGQPLILSEVAGFQTRPSGDLPYYASIQEKELPARMKDLLVDGIGSLQQVRGFVLTQWTDVGRENNGVLHLDRKPKVSPAKLAAIMAEAERKALQGA